MRKTAYLETVEEVMTVAASHLRHKPHSKHHPVLYLPGNASRIGLAEDIIFRDSKAFAGTRVFQLLSLGPAEGWAKANADDIRVVTPFIGAGVRDLVNAGAADFIRCDLSRVPSLFEGRWKPDVAIAHVSPPDGQGRVTLGLDAGITIGAVRSAKFRIAVVNTQMPRFHIGRYFDPSSGKLYDVGCAMYLNDFDIVVETDEPLLEHPMNESAALDPTTDAIATNILKLLERDRKPGETVLPHTLQMGIGKVPDAVAMKLASTETSVRRIFTELLSNGLFELVKKGLVRPRKEEEAMLRSRVITGLILGTNQLYQAMHENPMFAVLPQEIINNPWFIAQNEYMVSINAAISVSVKGEVASSTIGATNYSGDGGQNDFITGASMSRGGLPIIALPSIVERRKGSVESRIVVAHPAGAHYTVRSSQPVVVVTEHGYADLRECTDAERAGEIINIAHPGWCKHLSEEARALPSLQGAGLEIQPRLGSISTGQYVLIRPATPRDIPAIDAFIRGLSDEDRYTRYMVPQSIERLTEESRLTLRYRDTLDFITHACFFAVLGDGIVGVTHAHKETDGVFELSFSRSSAFKRLGIGKHLMRAQIDWAASFGAKELHAVTWRSNEAMRALFRNAGFTELPDPDDTMNVIYRASVIELAKRAIE